MHPAFVTAVVTIALMTLVIRSAPHRRIKVGLAVWLGSVLFGAYVLRGSGWSSIVSFFTFWTMVGATVSVKGVPMFLHGVSGGSGSKGM